MSTQAKSDKGCRFCDGRKGLAIMPVRYAVARHALGGNAPKVSGQFNATKDAGGNVAQLALPEPSGDAKGLGGKALPERGGYYTTRVLRKGFLYVYDEHLKEWKGYKVTDLDYLYPFERGEQPPRGDITDVKISCSREGCENIHHLARYVFLKDAEHATKVQMVFSDVLWTDAVWKQYDDADFRTKHMRTFDVAAWRGGGKAAHADDLYNARDHVAELCADPTALERATRQYVKQFLPKGWTVDDLKTRVNAAREGLGDKQDDLLLQTVPALVKRLAPSYATPLLPATCYDYAAWIYSPQPFHWESADDVTTMLESARVSGSLRPALLALDDPAGVAMELNGLVIQQIGEITADPTYFWKMRTATTIDTLRQTVMSGAVNQERASREDAKRQKLFWGTSSPQTVNHGLPPNGPLAQPNLSAADKARYDAEIAQAGELPPAEKAKLETRAWDDYAPYYDAAAVKSFLATAGDTLKDAALPLLDLLDKPYAAWLGSPLLRNYFQYHFDAANAQHGVAYATLARLLLNEAGGRTVVAKFLDESFKQQPSDRSQWALRALQGDQDSIIAASGATAGDLDAQATGIAKVIESVAGTGATAQQLGQAIAAYTQQVSGAWVACVGQSLRGGSAANAGWMLAVVGALAKLADPSLKIVRLTGSWTQAQAAHTMAQMLAAVSGQGSKVVGNRHTRRALASDKLDKGKRYAYNAILVAGPASEVVEAVEGKKLRDLKQWQQAELLEGGMEQELGALSHMQGGAAVASGLFALVTVGASYEDMMHAAPDAAWDARINFGTSASTLTGQIGEGMAKALRAAPTRLTKFAPQLAKYSENLDGLAELLEGGGKIFGFVGGLVAGVWMLWQGEQELASGDNQALGFVHVVAGTMLTISAFMLLATSLTWTVIGAVIALVVAIVLAVVDLLELDHLQRWLNKAHFFGKQTPGHWYNFEGKDDYQAYPNPVAQDKGLQTVVGAAA